MIPSLQAIDFVYPDGTTTRLLDFNEIIEAFIALPVEQRGTSSAPIGSRWGNASAEGAGRSVIAWSRIIDHTSHRAAHRYCMTHPALMPLGITGKLLFHQREAEVTTDANDEIWQLDQVIVNASSPAPYSGFGKFATICSYRVEAGKRTPIKGNFDATWPIGWNLTPIGEDVVPFGDPATFATTPYVPPAPVPGEPPELDPYYPPLFPS